MKILVIGSGGREHAICHALRKSPKCEKLYIAPGNAGIARIATTIMLAISNHEEVIRFCHEKEIDLVIIGPEAPLVEGLADSLTKEDIVVYGPSKAASRLEGSKAFTKYICDKYDIATAAYREFIDEARAKEYVDEKGVPIVIKADGLAAGKGVIIAQTKEEAYKAIEDILVKKEFGSAGNSIVIEEFLEGEEISVFAIADGKRAVMFGSAQDHKAAYDGDKGPNTGGMGTYSPAPVMTPALEKQIKEETIDRLMFAMSEEGAPFKGTIFAGFMVTKKGPVLLEINVRFGDPETQVLMARLKSDLVDIMHGAATGNLPDKVEMNEYAALCVVMAANGYPGHYKKGTPIRNLDKAESMEDTIIFHAGTKLGEDKEFASNGGRVLGVTALGKNVTEAQKKAYKAVDKIDWKDGFCRRDIGWRAVAREKQNAA